MAYVSTELFRNAAAGKQVNAVFQCEITCDKGDVKRWTIDLTGAGKVTKGAVAKADCTFAISEEDFVDAIDGKNSVPALFWSGKLKITGNMSVAMALGQLLTALSESRADDGPPTVVELWLYPVKALRGIQVPSARLTPTGFELDRAFCIVDADGTNVSQYEAISQRKMPFLANVTVALSQDLQTLTLSAPGMPDISIPTSLEAFQSEADVRVECSGKSTTSGQGWSLGFIDCKEVAQASEWITKHINAVSGTLGSKPSRYFFCRAKGSLAMAEYPPVFPLIERAKVDKAVRQRFHANEKRFADFAPLHLVTRESAGFVAQQCGVPSYSTRPFRANLIVAGTTAAWDEENWKVLRLERAGHAVTLRKIKECPRCTVPCRDADTGKPIFEGDLLKLWKVLKKAFPEKYDDPEWGSWSGAFMGVYYGHASVDGEIRVGDRINVIEREAWDAHLRQSDAVQVRNVRWGVAVSAVLVAVGLGIYFARTRK